MRRLVPCNLEHLLTCGAYDFKRFRTAKLNIFLTSNPLKLRAEIADLGEALQMYIDRNKFLRQLALVHNRIMEGDGNVARHRKAVAELERDGQDAGLAQKMLIYAEHVQTMNLTERQRLERIFGEKIEEPEKIYG
jgi:hypothetical protein